MTAMSVELVEELETRITLKRTLAEYVFNDFTIEKTFLPVEQLEDLVVDHPGGKVYLIGLDALNAKTESRTDIAIRRIPVQVAYQRGDVDGSDFDVVKDYVEFVEQLKDTCRLEVNLDLYSWSEEEGMVDDNQQKVTPYSYLALQDRVFFAYFTAIYLTTLSS